MVWSALFEAGYQGLQLLEHHSLGSLVQPPHVRVAAVEVRTWTTVSELQVWNPKYAFAYPFLDVNAKDEVGIITGWGGAQDNANTAEGILGDFVVWYHNGSEVTPRPIRRLHHHPSLGSQYK